MNDSEIAELIAKLDDEHKPTVRAAVDALISLAGQFPGVQETLSRRLADTEREQKWPLAYILAHLPRPSQRTIRTLLDALDHREADIRWAIALLLVRIAKDQPAMVNQLMDLCATGTANQKRMALYCIRDLTLSDANSLAALLGALRDLDPTVRVAAAISLKSRSDLDHAGRDALLQAYLKDTEVRVRNAAAITLAHLGETSAEFLSALQQAVDGEDEQARKTAATALALIKKNPLQRKMNPAEADPRWTEGDSQAPGPNPRQRFRLEPKSQPPRSQYIYQSCLDHLLSLLTFSVRK